MSDNKADWRSTDKPGGSRHSVKAAPSPVGVPPKMQTFKPVK